MRLKLTYCVDNPNNDTSRLVELISDNVYQDISEAFMDALAAAQHKAETIYDVTIDTGGDDDWHDLDMPDVIFEDEVKEMAPKFVAILKEIESALVEFEVKA